MIEQKNANKKRGGGGGGGGESQYVNFCAVWRLWWTLGYQFDYKLSINYADNQHTRLVWITYAN